MKALLRYDHTPVTETTPLVVAATLPVRDHKTEQERTISPTFNASIIDDILDTLKLGVPIAISYLSWVGVSQLTMERERAVKNWIDSC
jgi:hypothetical protein